MGKQQKLKAARRQQRAVTAFLLEVQELSKENPDFKYLWDKIAILKSTKASEDEIKLAISKFTNEYIKLHTQLQKPIV